MRNTLALCLVAVLGLAPLCARAQTHYDGVDSYEEYAERVKAAQEIAPVFDTVFGDKVRLYNGSTNFEVTDVSIPGNSTLSVTLSRELVIRDLRGQPQNGDGLPGFGDWNLSVPYIDGTFTQDYGWALNSLSGQPSTSRCSDNVDVPYTWIKMPNNPQTQKAYVSYYRIWNGNELHIPGRGDQTLLVNNQAKSYAYTNDAYTGSSVWKWVTTGNWKLRCTRSVVNMTGEGFKAVSPMGVSYTFDYAVVRPTSSLANASNDQTGRYAAMRLRIFLLATHVEDRFGNWVNYSYSADHLMGITSSDGRSIGLHWSGDKITSVTSALGTWAYGYATASWMDQFGRAINWPYLSSVTRPDGSKWSYVVDSGSLVTNKNDWPGDEKPPVHQCQFESFPNSGAFRYTVGAPSGASATYSFTYGRQYRDMVPRGCTNDPDPNLNYPLDATNYFDNFYLTSKQVSGPGLSTENYTYSGYTILLSPGQSYLYATAPYSDIGSDQPYEPPGNCSACPVSKVVTVAGPVNKIEYTYGIQYARNEGQLLRTQITDRSGNVLKTTTNTYVTDALARRAPFPDIAGLNLLPNYISPMDPRNRPVARTATMQDGVTFTATGSRFDALARATSATESSSLGSRSTAGEYADNPWLWTLGQPLSQSVNGVMASQTDYNAEAQPVHTWRFGKLKVTRAWNADGTLQSYADGNNRTTTLSSWKRGLPQSVAFADGSSESAAVNDAGWITSVKDENGFTTSYGYDAMGRLASITYPTGDDVSWSPTLSSFVPVGSSERGIPAGHWKQTVRTGNGYAVTYFDAMWRPLVTEHYDGSSASIKAATLSQTVHRYDAEGRKVFTSYPTNVATSYAQALPGTVVGYDALNRVVQVVQDSELGGLPTTTQYLSGFRSKVTDPRGNSTTTSYQAFGEPDASYPVSIAMPEGATITILRDPFGKPLSIERSGTYGGSQVSVIRSFVYDANQLLCKRIEPETGATLFAYDGAGNIAWSASGATLTGNSCDRGSVSATQVITRGYDARNRLTAIAYPDGISNTQFTYAADGAMLSATNSNGGNTVDTQYAYDKRRLQTAEAVSVPGAGPFAIGYGRDANGHLASLLYPDGRIITFAPNALGQPTQAGSYATSVAYFPNGAIKQFAYGDGSVHTLTQNLRGLPERSRDSSGATAVLDNSTDYDSNGNVAAITDGLFGNVGNLDMGYDGLDRLIAATSPMFAGNHQATFTYDPLDNLRSAMVGNGNQYTYSYNADNRLASMTGSQSYYFGYDARGNQTGSNAQAYTFDMANRLRAANELETYLYDAAGRRARKSSALTSGITYYAYDRSGELLYETDSVSTIKSDYVYLHGSLIARITQGQPDPPPSAPASINVPASSNDGNVAILWSAVSGATGYVLEQQFNGGSWTQVYTGSATSKALIGLASGSYVYRVQACSAAGCGAMVTSDTLTVSVPQVPPTPASINVPASSNDGNVMIWWSAVSGATGYVLQQQFNGGTWVQAYSGGVTSKVLAGLANGRYIYRVQACNAVGCGAFVVSGALTVALIPAPPASIDVPASSYSPSIAVSWSASANTSNYVLEESANGGGWGVAWNGNATGTTVTVSSSGSYRFQVSACGAGGCSGFRTSGNVAVTLKPASAPSLSGPSSSSSGTFTLSWSAVTGTTSYRLHQVHSGSDSIVYNSSGRSWASSALGNGSYAYHVDACNAVGCSASSNALTVNVLHVPAAPTSVTAPAQVPATVPFRVSWDAVSGASSYTLRQTRQSNNAVTTIYSGGATSTWLSRAPGLFQFAVQACNTVGCSTWVNASNYTDVEPKGNR